MANYYCSSMTNYFQVTDEEKFREIVGKIACEDNIEVWKGANNTFGFGAHDVITCYYDDESGEYKTIYEDLQTILPDGEAIIMVEVGNEKLRYLVGHAVVITNKKIKHVDLQHSAIVKARQVLQDKTWDTEF